MHSEKIYCKYLNIFFLMLSINLIYADKKQPILDDIAPTVTVSPYDCSGMSENNLYSLKQVKPCNVAPENIDMSYAKVKMYTKHFRTEINATICSVKHQRNRFYCGMHDHSSIDIKQKTITSYLDLSPAQCRLAAEASQTTLLNHQLTMKKRYYIGSRNDSENKYLFEIKNRPHMLCNKPSDVYPTTYESLFVAICYGGFDMKTGRNMIQQVYKVHKMLYTLMTKKKTNQAKLNSGLLVTIIQTHIPEHG